MYPKALSRRQSDGESVWDAVVSRSWPGRKSLNVLIHEAGPVPTGHSGTQGLNSSRATGPGFYIFTHAVSQHKAWLCSTNTC